jgi:hypothetical protein
MQDNAPPLDDDSLDVAVFSLSLMEKWTDFIAKSKRCLVKKGYLFIAETKVLGCLNVKKRRYTIVTVCFMMRNYFNTRIPSKTMNIKLP